MPSHLQSQDSTFSVQTPKGTWRWTTRVDVSSTAPRYEVRDILSPYGILRDSIPIPGDVITAMAQSIATMATAYAPHILIAPTSLTFVLDEGRGYGDPLDVTVTNDGVFGSLLNATVSTSAPWLTTNLNRVSVAYSAAAIVQISASSLLLTAGASPYAGTITFQDPAAGNSPVTIPVTVVVRPKAHLSVTPTSLTFFAVAPLSGPFAEVPEQTFTITNTGPTGSVLDYTIRRLTNCAPWLSIVTPTTGTLTSGQSQVVTVEVVPPANLLTGTYTETLRISGYSDNSYQDVTVTLTVT